MSMFGDTVRAFWEDVRGDASGQPPSSGASGDSRSRPHSKLFRCPECEDVYLALEKEVCSSCCCEVTEVSPTLDG